MSHVENDLRERGYAIIRKYINQEQIDYLLEQYQIADNQPQTNKNVPFVFVQKDLRWDIANRIKQTMSICGLDVDILLPGCLFANASRGPTIWHQEYESFFTFQQTYNHLNFHITLTKPDPTKSGVCVVPFDVIKQQAPEYFDKIQNNGATSFTDLKNATLMKDDANNIVCTIPFSFEKYKVIPDIGPGDLLLLRGDTIHRTQDGLTPRIAVSIHATQGSAIISNSVLTSGGKKKRETLINNSNQFMPLIQFLRSKQTATVREWCERAR